MTITTQTIDTATQTLMIDATGTVGERDCYMVEELARAAGMVRFVVRLPHPAGKPGGYVALEGSAGDLAASHRAAAVQQDADDAAFWV